MTGDRVEVEGLATFRATLNVASRRIEDMSAPGRETGAFLESRGRADAPRRTGALAASVRSTADSTTAEVSSALPYANRVHWGYARYGQRAQPWLSDGAERTEATWIANYQREIEDVLDGVKGA